MSLIKVALLAFTLEEMDYIVTGLPLQADTINSLLWVIFLNIYANYLIFLIKENPLILSEKLI